jgi:hypothetical protein
MCRQCDSIIPEEKGFRKRVVLRRLVKVPSDVHHVLFRRSVLPETWLSEVQSHIKHGYTTALTLYVLLSYLSRLCLVFTIIYLKQTMFLGYIVLQLFYIYNLCYT